MDNRSGRPPLKRSHSAERHQQDQRRLRRRTSADRDEFSRSAHHVDFTVATVTDTPAMSVTRFTPTWHIRDYSVFINDIQAHLVPPLQRALRRMGGIKYHVCLTVTFENLKNAQEFDSWVAAPEATQLLAADHIAPQLDRIAADIVRRIDEYSTRGSGWAVASMDRVELICRRFVPFPGGSSYFPSPKKLANKTVTINIQNKTDDKCFMWCILAQLHPCKKNRHEVSKYRRYANDLNFDGITFPVSPTQIDLFEEQNHIPVSVFSYSEDLESGRVVIYPLRITKIRSNTTPSDIVNLILLTRGRQQHYVLITDFNRLLYDQNKHKCRKYFCPYCLGHFGSERLWNEHVHECSNEDARVEMPTAKMLKFRNYHKSAFVPVNIVADFECFNTPIDSCLPDPNISSTTRKSRHDPNSFCAISIVDCGCARGAAPQMENYKFYRGDQPVERFLRHVLRVGEALQRRIDRSQPLVPTDQQTEEFENANDCHICDQPLMEDRVKDHCHICGSFRGAAHQTCNLAFIMQRDLHVWFHNLTNYDGRLIVFGIGEFALEHNFEIKCIPKTTEKYLTFSIRAPWVKPDGTRVPWNIKFLDSCQFLSSSLEQLVDSLLEKDRSGESKFAALAGRFPDPNQRHLLLQKGVYPYEYVTGVERFLEKQLPPKSAFYNSLKLEDISDVSYQHAQNVWTTFNCINFGQYHDLYLVSDVYLLADVLINFRQMCYKYYKIDPLQYISLPSFAWDCALRYTGVRLDLLQEQGQYEFFEKGIRGGVAVVSHRLAQANNPLMGELYDSTKDTSFIVYFDATNLYGFSMQSFLPTGNFRWLSDDELKVLNNSEDCGSRAILAMDDKAPVGWALEVNLEVPAHLHNHFADYPLAPESLTIDKGMLSPYSRRLRERLDKNSAPVQKLAPNLMSKHHYIVHYTNLKFYISQGLRLTRIHRGIEFSQSAWLLPYIRFNSERRAEAKSKFSQDLFKLLVNSVFGKSMESVRKYKEVLLETQQTRIDKLVAKDRYQSSVMFTPTLTAVVMRKKKIVLNKPIYTGFTVLDISKLHMFRFHYGFISPQFGARATLLFTDTDSLCYRVTTQDVYEEIMKGRTEWFDCSVYPTTHQLYDRTNFKKVGTMKDEFPPPNVITEVVALRAKLYSIKTLEDCKKVGKGINRAVLKRQICHEDYVNCLTRGDERRHYMQRFKSHLLRIYTLHINKISLSSYEDKRFVLTNGVSTLPYGHHLTTIYTLLDEIVSQVEENFDK